MSGGKRFVLLGVLALLTAVVVMFPARTAYNWFAPEDLQLSGINGTVWSGSAAEVLVRGIYMRNLSWSAQPLALLTGKLAFSTKFDPANGFVDANVAVAPTGSVTLSYVSGTLPLEIFHEAVRPIRGVRGNLNLDLQEVVIDGGGPTFIAGKVSVSNLTAARISPAPIGTFEAVISTDSQVISGIVTDISGVLIVNAVLQISADRDYSLVGQVAARPGAPGTILTQLELLGSADAQGNREFRIEGRL